MIYNPYEELIEKIKQRGGFVNAHAHFDRAYTVTREDLEKVVYNHLYDKWFIVDKFKEEATIKRYSENITTALIKQKEMLTTSCLSFIDVDSVVGLKALRAAGMAKEFAKKTAGINFKVAVQTLKGVITPHERIWVDMALNTGIIDIVGSLPGANKRLEGTHLDIILEMAKKHDKLLHSHVDQLNTRQEKETELLARKTMDHGYEGKVTAVHSISLACHPKWYRKEVYKMAKDAGLSFIACPTAWIDSRRTEEMAPIHNAITPVDELIEHDLIVAIGSDNIHDIYKPYSTGDMRTELKFLLEATHIYDEETLIKISTENGLKVIGEYDGSET